MSSFTKILIASLALAAPLALGCGSKAKPAETTATTTTGTDDGASGDTTGGDTDTSGDNTPDPATLGEVVYFEFDSSDLSPEARAQLEENARWLAEDAGRTLTIEGHTDEVGTAEYNLGLGDRRARAAQDYLVKLGTDSSRIRIITFGEERPAAGDAAKNRRSMFIATKK